jgi:hypothetical protein
MPENLVCKSCELLHVEVVQDKIVISLMHPLLVLHTAYIPVNQTI